MTRVSITEFFLFKSGRRKLETSKNMTQLTQKNVPKMFLVLCLKKCKQMSKKVQRSVIRKQTFDHQLTSMFMKCKFKSRQQENWIFSPNLNIKKSFKLRKYHAGIKIFLCSNFPSVVLTTGLVFIASKGWFRKQCSTDYMPRYHRSHFIKTH